MEGVETVCGACKRSVSLSELSTHYREFHNEQREFSCGEAGCKVSFLHKSSMIRHITSTHGQHPPILPSLPSATHDSPQPTPCSSDRPETACSAVLPVDPQTASSEVLPMDSGECAVSESLEEVLQKKAASLVLSLRASPGVTGNTVMRVQEQVTAMLQTFSSKLASEISSAETITEIMSTLTVSHDPFSGMETIDDQLKYFEEHHGLVQPEDLYLGSYMDTRLDVATCTFVQATVPKSFQSIDFIASLKGILSNESVRKNVFRDFSSRDGNLRSHIDGDYFKNHPFLKDNPNNPFVLHILLYYDELEVANALGSKTTIHKLGVFFFQILNLPTEQLSQLSSIHLLALAHADDLKTEDAFIRILTPFIMSMKKLSSEDGVQFDLNGETFTVKALLVGFSADTLAAHDVVGLLAPSATFFCRCCLVTRKQLLLDSNIVGEARSMECHREHVEKVKKQKSFSKKCGVKRGSPLTQIPFFDLTKQCVFDIFHDILEGTASLYIKLVLREWICIKKLLTLEEFNGNVASFSYGAPDKRNKPSPTFTEAMLWKGGAGKLKQIGSQMWCLLRALPFLIGIQLPEGDKHLQLIFLMQDIACIVFSPVIRPADIDTVDKLISDHNALFKELFIVPQQQQGLQASQIEDSQDSSASKESDLTDDEVDAVPGQTTAPRPRKKRVTKTNMINKMHHMKHYAETLRQFGPLVRLWCAKFEGRMKIFRQYASVCGNFQNIPKTMAKMFQLCTLSSILEEQGTRLDHHKRGEMVSVEKITASNTLSRHGISSSESLFLTDSATLNGEEYRVGTFVCVKSELVEETFDFALVKKVFVYKDMHIFLGVERWMKDGLSSTLNAFKVLPAGSSQEVVAVTELSHHRCIAPWSSKIAAGVFLSLRTIVVM